MAYTTLGNLRAALNTDLGRTDGTSAPWGSNTDCNTFIADAIKRLWPRMGRLTYQDLTPVALQEEYTLTSIRDVVRIEIIGSSSARLFDLKNWRVWTDETSASLARKIKFPGLAIDTSTTLHVVGYQPYANIDTSNDANQSDFQSELDHIIITGARANAYRRRFNTFMNFEQHVLEDPTTRTGLNEYLQAYLSARAEFDQLISEHPRDQAAGKRAGIG